MTEEKAAPELGAACIRMMRALARRAGEGELEALEQLAALEASVQVQLGAAVAGYRGFTGAGAGARPYSWADVGTILGVSRQAAFKRFHKATAAPAHGPRCQCRACRRLAAAELTTREWGARLRSGS